MENPPISREGSRLQRQFEHLRRTYPKVGRVVYKLSRPGWRLLRVPVGVAFVLGGFLAILPVLGLWMIPIGLLLLAVDVPWLRRPVAGSIIRLRRRADTFRQRHDKD